MLPGQLPSANGLFAFRAEYVRGRSAEESLARALAQGDALAIVRFGPNPPATNPRIVTVPLRELGPGRTLEVWRSPRVVTAGVHDGISFAHNGCVLFGHVCGEDERAQYLERKVHDLYRQVYALVKELGYQHIYRMWNFFSDINVEHAGLERYKAFCCGRHSALSAALPRFEHSLPAATAVGSRVPGIVVYFLAARTPGSQIENPRQVSAFHYPARYGPKSPSFSRSILKSWSGGGQHLYISGTASIVGHVTRHAGDVGLQLTEALDNVEALLAAANEHLPNRLNLSHLRVYLRDATQETLARRIAGQRLGPLPMVIVEGDICRADLLLEVEGLAISAPGAGSTELAGTV